ncbi:MAG: hypothetical protein KatS3mg087_1654 [Patescibacteria group bacterium]|nr:MAG: hypothetical protein KatS3mg087_1654 [Patescibacteria group bacterium]
MPSKVEIANKALIRLGVDTISSFTEDSEPARKVNAIWNMVLEEILSEADWNFAKRWATLARVDETPINGFTYAYQLPTNPKCIKVIRFYDDATKWVIEDGKLYTNAETAKIRYIALVDDAGKYPIWFANALSYKLAYELAYSLTGKTSREQQLLQEYQAALDAAMAADAQEGTPDVVDQNPVSILR